MRREDILGACGLGLETAGGYCGEWLGGGDALEVRTPIDGSVLGRVRQCTRADYERIVARAHTAFERFRLVPAPRRGEIVRQLGEALRGKKAALGALVTLEMGKIRVEGEGEVQEMIDVCDFATGLSRQLHGLTMPSERPGHRMLEQWHPLGVVGVITAFNFPVAVWSWNAALALVCGDAVLWKPSRKTPLSALAVTRIAARVLEENGVDPAVASLCVGPDADVGEALLADRRIPLVSATGSCRMGRRVAEVVGARLGRTLLELGGNNALIVMPSADLDLAARAVVFGAVGTTGQRCTSTRRLIVHERVADALVERLVRAYGQVRIGDPLADGTLMGPLVSSEAADAMQRAITVACAHGGRVVHGGERLEGPAHAGGGWVRPCILEAPVGLAIVRQETFAPILYVQRVPDLEAAIALQNEVPQGLSSAVFTRDVNEAEAFLGPAGSDCGIANVNLGTSGAEIGGAFGGEKDTGGGRESGSDAWKAYMRRQTCTINGSGALPLAQGIVFE